jgi:hypothetical protein
MQPAVNCDRALGQVRRIVLQYVGPTADVLLFGSWARGDQRPASDVDVALDAHGRKLDRLVLARLRDALEESRVPWRVDVVDLAECDPAFRLRVLGEAIRWTD